jgi:hypothetical protein
MCKIVYDFIKSADRSDGFGYFADNESAVMFAKAISRSQRRKYNRYGIIPAAFFDYLESIDAIKREKFIPEKDRTVDHLLDLLWITPNRNQQERSDGECLRVEILKDVMPWLKKSFGLSDHTWKKLERLKKMKEKD